MRIITSILLFVICLSCSNNTQEKQVKNASSVNEPYDLVPLKWAKNFRIKAYKTHKTIELLANNTVYQTFTISDHKRPSNSTNQHFTTPLTAIASASCVYTKMFEILGGLQTIKGIDQLKFQYSDAVANYVNTNQILEFGSGEALNTEELFILSPNVLFTWSSNQNNQQINKLIKLGIPVVFASSYLENHPLARAEWIKFFGLFIDKYSEAEAHFNKIEAKYLAHKSKLNSQEELTLVNAPYSGQWYLPTGNSYMGNLLKDAHFSIYLKDTLSTGAKPYTFEDVITHHQDAKFWINPSHYETLAQIEQTDSRFNQLNAFKQKRVYNATKRKRENGGNDYWEQGVIRPDLVLKDLNHIFNSDPIDSLYFFTKLD